MNFTVYPIHANTRQPDPSPTAESGREPDNNRQFSSPPQSREQYEPLIELWNHSLGAEFALSAQHLAYRFQPSAHSGPSAATAAGSSTLPPLTLLPLTMGLAVASLDPKTNAAAALEQPAGMILVSAPAHRTQLHIDGLAVHPDRQGQGMGRALIDWARAWGETHGCREIILGSGPLRLLPGVPQDSPTPAAVWTQLGFHATEPVCHDLAADISGYMPPEIVVDVPGQARPLAQHEQTHLRPFLAATLSPARQTAIEHFLANGGRITDMMALWTDAGVQAIAQITAEDSVGGIEPWFPYTLPKPWAALQIFAPPTLKPALRWALLDAALRRLHNMGVNSCILADIADPAPYADFGFQPYHTFRQYRL